MPSLYGAFPEGMRGELQGFVSEAEWEEGRNRTSFEFSKIKDSSLMAGFIESDFRWAYSVRPAGAIVHDQAYGPCTLSLLMRVIDECNAC